MNRFKQPVIEEEEDLLEENEPELVRRDEAKPVVPGFLSVLFTEGGISKEAATAILPFLLFLGFLGMLYIANSHMAVSNVRSIDKLSKEVKELSWEYKSLKAELMYKSKLTEVAKIVDTLGVKELTEPPKKIVVASNEY